MSVWPSSPCPAAATAAGKQTALKIPSRLIFLKENFERGVAVEIVSKLLDWSLRQHWALGGSFLFFMALMCMPAFRDTAQNPKDRDRWLKGLRDNSPAEFYRSVMRRGLDWLDTRLSPHEAQKGPAQKAWSYGLLNITMALAIVYPILAMMAQ